MTANKRRFSWGAVLLVLLAMCLVYYLASGLRSQDAVSYAQVRQLFLDEKVQEFAISDTRLTAKLSDGSTVSCDLYDFQVFYDDLNDLVQQQHDQGIIRDYTYHADHSTNWLQLLLPYVLVILGFILLMNLMARMTGAGPGGAQDRMSHFGDARVQDTPQDSKVTFQDVAGEDEEKEELREIVEFLRQPDKYLALGARIPKGVLLVGPPGTGKTLLAKAVAGEAGVKFLSISGSDFVEMYVGVGASRVRDLFRQAKQNAPAIIFIDEIDAVGRQRGSGLGGGHDEREQTLNQLLVEMDGFTANEGVVVLAATNRVDILDPALLRPGRFDRQVYVGLPDIKGRRDILAVHARNKPLAEDVDLDKLAKGTSGFTGADLENLLNEAALLAGRRDEKAITMDDLQKSVIKVIAGPEKHSRVIPEHERRLTAYHEAGHAVVMHALPDLDPVHQITIVPRGQAGGMTIYLPDEDRSYLSRSYLLDNIAGLLGGRAAEQLVLGDISTGASNDISRATQMARKMVGTYGMSDRMGNAAFDAGHDEVFIGKSMAQTRPYSEETAAEMDQEIRRIMDEAYGRCRKILEQYRPQLDQVAQFLLQHETMTAQEFRQQQKPQPEKPPLGSYTARPAAPTRPVRPAEQPALAVRDVAPEPGKAFTAPTARPGVSYHITPPSPVPAAEPQEPAPVREEPPVQETVSLPEQVTLEPPHEAPWRIAGEVLRTYIICEDEGENVWLIDKHAAHERVRFDALKAATEPIMSQTLLEPMAVELSPEDCAAVLEQLPLLERYGCRCEDFGGAVLVREVPGDIDDPTGALEELAEDLRLNRADPDAARDSLLQTMACKSAIKAGMHTDPAELRRLVDRVQSGEIQYCPHGRPVAVKLSKYQVEKMFKRA